MRTIGLVVVFTLLAGPSAALLPDPESHVHIGHVLDAWPDTPGQMGLLPTAQAEAAIAMKHIELALAAKDLKDIRRHIGHVMHALDPEVEANGTGLGYGLFKATRGVSEQVGLAYESNDASINVQNHARHVGVSATNVMEWARAALDLARTVRSAAGRGSAKFGGVQIEQLLCQIVEGVDANGDGTVSWERDEGGLAQAEKHMTHMAAGEGLI